MCICIYVYINMYICICIYVFVRIHIYVHIHIYIYIYIHIYIYICIYIYMYVYVYIYIYIHIYMTHHMCVFVSERLLYSKIFRVWFILTPQVFIWFRKVWCILLYCIVRLVSHHTHPLAQPCGYSVFVILNGVVDGRNHDIWQKKVYVFESVIYKHKYTNT